MLDLIAATTLTASAAVLVATIAFLFGDAPSSRLRLGAAFAAWFAAVVALGATDALANGQGLGPLGLPATVVAPLVVLVLFGLGAPAARARALLMPMPILIGVHAVRVLGLDFVLLYADGRLPSPFAPVAGWGDIAVGLLALPVAALARRNGAGAATAVFGWNMLGLLDLIVALGLGATSSPGPIRLFWQEPGAAIMTSLPWLLIPGFIVPCLAFLHVVIFYKLAAARRADKNPAGPDFAAHMM